MGAPLHPQNLNVGILPTTIQTGMLLVGCRNPVALSIPQIGIYLREQFQEEEWKAEHRYGLEIYSVLVQQKCEAVLSPSVRSVFFVCLIGFYKNILSPFMSGSFWDCAIPPVLGRIGIPSSMLSLRTGALEKR